MIQYIQEPNKEIHLKSILHPLVNHWFFSKFTSFTEAQLSAVFPIHCRENILVSSPTGSGKTLTAFLSILNELIDSSQKGILEDRIYCVYVSPLKALSTDIAVNLLDPLKEMEELAEKETGGKKKLGIRVGVRTGDTTAYEKSKMAKLPPHILITTPESLAIVINSPKFSEYLKQASWLIIDEIHSLAENKRGVHLNVTMERLQQLSPGITRIGLSATIAPLEEIAKFLVGYQGEEFRHCKIVDVQFEKNMDLQVISPVKSLVDDDYMLKHKKMYEMIHQLIKEHKTTLIFTNTRSATERVVHNLKEFYPKDYVVQEQGREDSREDSNDIDLVGDAGERTVEGGKDNHSDKINDVINDQINVTTDEEKIFEGSNKKGTNTEDRETKKKINELRMESRIAAHHGSLSKSARFQTEQDLREGKLKAVVCSTSLELGIDIGYIDLVLCLGSPKSVARFLQRAGRAGHQLHGTIKGRIIVMDRDDLVECSILLKAAKEKKIDRVHIPKNALDVLAQHIYGIAIHEVTNIYTMFHLIKNCYCYHTLEWDNFFALIRYLSGQYVSLEERHVYARIWYDPETGDIGKKGKMARVIYMTNIGTIPEESYIQVKVGEQIVGMVDEGFLERLKPGDVFVLGGNVYMFKFSRGMTAQVSTSVNRPPTVPSWFSEMLPLSFDLAMEINRFRRLLEERFASKKSEEEIIAFINEFLYVDEKAANSIYQYFYEQFNYSQIPSDRKIVIEHYVDRERRYTIFHTLFGRRVNDCLSRALAYVIGKSQHRDVEMGITDNGFYLSADQPFNALRAFELLKAEDFRQVLEQAIEKSEVLQRRFRHCAARSLMILRSYMGHTKRAGRMQISSKILFNAVKRISNDFPIIKEARREVLEDLMDSEHASWVIQEVNSGRLALIEVPTKIPSPFAFSLIAGGYSDVLKIEDKQEFLRRMHQMVLAQIELKKGKKILKEKMEESLNHFSYAQFWESKVKEEQDEKDFVKEKMKMQVWNLKRVPVYVKEELVRLVEFGSCRKDILDECRKYREEIEKTWPEELKIFIFRKLQDL